MSLGGIATYVALLGLIAIWITPWVILSLILSGISDIDASVAMVLGLLLGPLSIVLLVLLAVNKKKSVAVPTSGWVESNALFETRDPFA